LFLCGIGTDDDWILNASYIDKTFQRHKLSYDLFRKMNVYNKAAHCAYASVYVNGKHEGLYVVMEEINGSMLGLKNGDDHAMLFKDPPIFYEERLDWVQDSNNYYQQKYPKISVLNYAEPLDRFNNIIFNSEDFIFDGVVPYWISTKNVIDWHLILLLTNNDDGLYKNFYLYKYGKINPFNIAIWDYDHSFGRDGDGELNMLDRNVDPEKIVLIKRLMESKEIDYRGKLTERWSELRENGTFTVKNLYDMIDENGKEIKPYLKSNFERWPLKSKWYQDANTYDQEIKIMKEYIQKRIPQLDEYFNTL
jgi:hypothetical protein